MSFRDELSEILTTNFAAIPEKDRPKEGTVDWHINAIINAVVNKLPEKKHSKNMRHYSSGGYWDGNKMITYPASIEEQPSHLDLGFNQALDTVRQILEGK